jgi:hypothetical protein
VPAVAICCSCMPTPLCSDGRGAAAVHSVCSCGQFTVWHATCDGQHATSLLCSDGRAAAAVHSMCGSRDQITVGARGH